MANVSVLIPTLGRVRQLESALEALRRGSRLPDQVVIVAQGAFDEVVALGEAFPELRVRAIRDDGRGRGRALNVGLKAVGDGIVMMTDDDCRVRADWVERGIRAVQAQDGVIVTGRVLTEGDLGHVPALRLDPLPRDYAGRDGFGRLTGGNIAARLSDIRALDGFDEAIVPGSEDNDFGWRWLKRGGVIRYDPQLVIWHDDWRDDEQLRAVFRSYGTGQGRFYRKHLAARDRQIVYFVARDLWAGIRMASRTLSRGRPPRSNVRWPFFPSLVNALAGRRPAVAAAGAPAAAPAGTHRPTQAPRAEGDDASVAVLIVTRNRRDHVIEAVASAEAQTVPLHILVIDDGSTDGTVDALRQRFPGIEVTSELSSLGPCARRNAGMRRLRSDFVVTLDDDAYFASPHTVEQTLATFDRPDVAAVTMPYLNARREHVLRHAPPTSPGAFVTGVFVGVAVMFRRSSYLDVGGYEESIGIRGEEGDLALRLIAGGHVLSVGRADPVVHWEATPVKPDEAFFLTARNEVLLTALRVPWSRLPWRLMTVAAKALLHGAPRRRLRPVISGLRRGVADAVRRRDERDPVPLRAYLLTRQLRRTGPWPLERWPSSDGWHTRATRRSDLP